MSIQPQQPQFNPYGPLVRPTSGYATASMILGIIGLCTVFPSLLAVLLGHMAYKETKDGYKAGHGQTMTGLILGYLVLVPVSVWIVLGIIGAILG